MHNHLTLFYNPFVDQEMDGAAITAGLASGPGPDWLKEVVPKVGLRLKVYGCIRSFFTPSQASIINS